MEIKVNDYVRTDNGYITKIIDFKEHYTKGRRLGLKEEVVENYLSLDNKQCEIIESIDYSIPPCYPSDEELEKIKNHIIKSSPRIIDLICVGDYVNGGKVYEKEKEYIVINADFGGLFEFMNIYEKNIKSIVTKEMFEQIEYKID